MHTLVVCDLDGTLLPEGSKSLNPEIFDLISRLAAKGVCFCVASGRADFSLRKLFAPVAEDIYFLSENSTVIHEGSRLLKKTVIPGDFARALVESINSRSDCFARVNTESVHYYIVPDASAKLNMFPGGIRVRTFDEVQGEISQVTACAHDSISAPAEELIPLWEGKINVAVNRGRWLDFSPVGKGDGLKWLCDYLHISLADVYAFGDDFNDVSMLELAGHPYIMDTAAESLRQQFPCHCSNVIAALYSLETQINMVETTV